LTVSDHAPTLHGIDRDALMRVVEPVARAHGVDVVEVTFKPERGGWVLRVAIEAPGSTEPGAGVTIERCAEMSRDLSAALDVAEVVKQPSYSLEVSSPGVERPLRTAAEFARFAGKRAKVVLREAGPDGQFSYDGAIVRAEGEAVTLAARGGEVTVPVGHVKRAHLVFEFGPAPRPGGKGRQQGAGQKGEGRRAARPGPNTRTGGE
jgi:ribosome maturation factor RimP